MNTAAAEDDLRQVSLTTTLSTDQSFEQTVASGQTLKFTVLADGTSVSVAKSDNADLAPVGDVVVPATVTEGGSTYTVTELAIQAFWTCAGLTSVRFEQGSQVKRLNDGALGATRTLRYVELPDSLETIGTKMFQFNAALQRVKIPDSVRSVGEKLFLGCTNLTDVYLGSGIAGAFPVDAFTDCVSLQTIVSKANFDSFTESAFDCAITENTKVYVADEAQRSAWVTANSTYRYGFNPDNILVEGQFFKVTVDTGKMTSLYNVAANAPMEEPRVPQNEGKSIEGWYTDTLFAERWNFDAPVTHDMTLYAKWADEIVDDNYLYRMRSDGQSLSFDVVDKSLISGDVVIPASHMFGGNEYPIAEIADYAFTGTGVTSVSIPASVKVIGTGSFHKCDSLQSVDLPPDSVLECISADAFSSSKLLRTFWVPRTLKQLGRACFYNCMGLESFTFAEGITELKALLEATFKQTSLTSLELPDSVTHMQEEVIRTCQKLESVKLPQSLEVLGEGALYSCTALTLVELPSTLKQVSNLAFAECTSLQAISLPAGLEVLQLPDTFRNCTNLSVIRASGSMSAVGKSITNALTQEQKGAITVVLPAVGDMGELFAQMEEAWTNYGFTKFSPMGGTLPTEGNTTDGRWELTTDGTLRIWCQRQGAVIQDLGWGPEKPETQDNWGPVRSLVTRIVMDDSVDAITMSYWFSSMKNLVDASLLWIPPSVTGVRSLLYGASALLELPQNFSLHEGITDATSMFDGCEKLDVLPEAFSLPSTITKSGSMFQSCYALKALPENFSMPAHMLECSLMFSDCRSLAALPNGFKLPKTIDGEDGSDFNNLFWNCSALASLPDGFTMDCDATVTNLNGMFQNCSSLVSLPKGFYLAPSSQMANGMFSGCTSLVSLPDGMTVPSGVTHFTNMFMNCNSLASLPDSFEFSTNPELIDGSGVFLVESGPVVPMYYNGPDERVKDYPWSSMNRMLVTQTDMPAGAKTIMFKVKEQGEEGVGLHWTTAYTDTSGMFVEPAAVPSRPNMVFTLWYTDPECTQRADFTKPFDADTTIYGKLAPGSHGAELPCEAGTGSAAWSFADDGTLYIRGAGEVRDFEWDWSKGTIHTEHWGPVRDLVTRVSMDPALKAKRMRAWFILMRNLTDVREVFIPQGALDVSRYFQQCYSLKSLPDGFVVPGSVTQTMGMFENCTSLVSLPSSFSVPDTVTIISGMFMHCKSLSSLPEKFKLPKSANVWLVRVFFDCPSLTTLPADFTFPNAAYLLPTSQLFCCDVNADGSRVPMYYAGNDPAVLDYDWTSQNRTLITTGEGATDKGLYPVEYKVMNPDRNAFETSASAFTTSDGLVPDLGTLQKLGYGFIGWFADEDCLEAFDFSRPVTEATTLYAKWAKHGGKGTDEGMLPTENSDGTTGQDAWWGIATDGALHIVCENGSSIQDLKMSWDDNRDKYWERYASEVSTIRMETNVRASSMGAWFQNMMFSKIDKGVFIPANCITARYLFYNCSVMYRAPYALFERAQSLTDVGGMFQSCWSLIILPEDFVLPSTVEIAWCLFYGTGIAELPEKFAFHEGLKDTSRMFYQCRNLTSLPENLVFPESATTIGETFAWCEKLTSVSAKLLEKIFQSPEGSEARTALNTGVGMFGFPQGAFPATDPLPTYFSGTAKQASLIDWSAQHRELVINDSSDRHYIARLWIMDKVGVKPADPWKVVYADSGNAIADPGSQPRAFQTFKGWYSDAACTDRVSFPLKLSTDTDLYALYETTGGTLPTINPDGTEGQGAQWSFDQGNHVLKIEATVPGAKVKKLFKTPDDAHASPTTGYWSPFRAQVQKVQMGQGVLVGGDDGVSGDMNYWFSGMSKLSSLDGVSIPEGTVSLDHTFNDCMSLATLPQDFALPDSVINMTGTFRGCKFKTLPDGFKLPPYLKRAAIIFGENLELVSLPEGFALPEGVIDANYLFWNCPKLKQLPSSFLLPTNLSNASAMFGGCLALTSLPAGFTIPASTNQEKKIDLSNMFSRCTTLAALPEGFSIPDSSQVSNVRSMFKGCSSLTSLPASLDLTGLQGMPDVETLFAPVEPETAAEITTYYAGSDPAKLSVDGGDATATVTYWKANYKRNLVATNGGQDMPAGMCTVNFMIPDTTGNSGYTLWQSVVVAQGSTLVDPQLASRYGVAFEGWFNKEAGGDKVVFGTTAVSNTTTMTLYARFSAPILKATAPASAKITVDASGTITKAPLRLTSQTAAPVRVVQAVATPNIEADMAVASGALDTLHLIIKPLVGKGSLDIYLDEVPVQAPIRKDGFIIPTATGPANPGVLDCSIGIEDLNPTDVIFYRDGFSTGLADITFTFEIAN